MLEQSCSNVPLRMALGRQLFAVFAVQTAAQQHAQSEIPDEVSNMLPAGRLFLILLRQDLQQICEYHRATSEALYESFTVPSFEGQYPPSGA